MNLSDLIARNAAFTPDKAALRFEGETLTYGVLNARIAAAARALRSEYGIVSGDRVAILSLNRPDYLVLLYACARLGAMLVPLNWRLTPAEQSYIVGDCAPKLLLLEEAFAGVLPDIARVLPGTQIIGFDFLPQGGIAFDALSKNDGGDGDCSATLSAAVLLVYTSGTTGRPRGAILTQEALLTNGVMSQHMHGLTSDDHVLTVLPFFHVGGLNIQTTPALHCGATVTIHARFSPGATLESIARDRPTLTVLVPAAIQALTEHPAWPTTDVSSLRAVATGSSIVPPALIARIETRDVPVLQVYGATETCPIAIYTRLGGERGRIGSTGLAGLCCEARLIAEDGLEVPPNTPGEIAIRGRNVFAGYWGDDKTTTIDGDGWYRSGDIARRDKDGYFFVLDRKNNMIISGGENVYPAEIERVLLENPEIAEAGVIGLPDARWQETPVAFVIRRPGGTVDAATLRAHAASRLARFKLPRDIFFVDDLPRTALGKVQHFKLKQMALGAGP